MSTIARLPDWPARLNAFIERRRHMPFKWGFHDCCQFARAGAAELLGVDPAASLALRPYRRCSGAALNLRRLGGVGALPAQCGFAEIPLTMARRGDVVETLTTHASDRPALGVCMGRQSAFPGKRGLVFLPTLECHRAWKV